ncbi:MAG: CHAT domain-containing protein [Ardenticatenaceae bacterium]
MHNKIYINFDIMIERWQDQDDVAHPVYRARVLNSPAGEGKQAFRLPFSEAQLSGFFKLVSRGQASRAAQGFGERLFSAVFQGTVGTLLRLSLDEAKDQKAGLRVRLRLTDVPELAAWPWEYLYDPFRKSFLALSDQTALVRYLELPFTSEPLSMTRPLRILIVMASPLDYRALDLEQEWKNIQAALSSLPDPALLVVERLEQATLSALQQQLRQNEYHVLHFMGHGTFDQATQEGYLVFENEKGFGDLASASALRTLLTNHGALRLVLLNTCKGAQGSQSSPFAGTAQQLVRGGVSSVIAMHSSISDQAAITLAKEFYRALADGYPVDAALAEARIAIFVQSDPTSQASQGAEWAVPILFMRAPHGRLFDMADMFDESDSDDRPAPADPPYRGWRYSFENQGYRFFGRQAGQEMPKRIPSPLIPSASWLPRQLLIAIPLLLLLLFLLLRLPQIAIFYNNRGAERHDAGDLRGAQLDYEWALKLNPDYIEAHYNLGLLYEDWHKPDMARAEYLVAVGGGSEEARNNLARLYISDQMYSEAVKLLLTALDKSENDEVRYNLLKNLGWARLGQGRYPEAESRLRDAIRLAAHKAAAHCLLAQVFDEQAKTELALTEWDMCLRYADKHNPDEDCWIGMAHERRKKSMSHQEWESAIVGERCPQLVEGSESGFRLESEP